MKMIEIDDDIYRALVKRIEVFGETPNQVIRRLLSAADATVEVTSTAQVMMAGDGAVPDPILDLVRSPAFLASNGKQRYFQLLRFLHSRDPATFAQFDGFKRGKRVNIARDPALIRQSGHRTMPEPLNGTGYHVLTNLSNARKRVIIAALLRGLRYPDDVVKAVSGSIPDMN